MTDELKPLLPCPCCNGTPSLMHGPGGDIWVKCPVCGLQTEMHPNNAAIAAWNRRYEPSDIPGWLKEKITIRRRELDRHIGNEFVKNTFECGMDAALKWVLSLRREDAE